MKIKNLSVFFISVFLAFSCSNASNDGYKSLLWKISGNGLENPSYLFGTHHLAPISFLDSIPGILEIFEQTEQTIGELDLSNLGEMQMRTLTESFLPDDVTYDSLLSKEDRQLLDSALQNTLGDGIDVFGQLKPAMLQNLISIAQFQKKYPSPSNNVGLDEYFQQEADKRFRPVIGLETVEDQIYVLLNAQTLERQTELLMCAVKHPDLTTKIIEELQIAYYNQDLDKIQKLYEEDLPNDPCPSTQEEKDIIGKNRNEKWLEKLPQLIEQKSSFIAVGCAHLPGKYGLIEGLRRLGYKVEPVK